MKQPVYKRDYNKSSLIFEQEKESQNALFQIRMLLENKIEGLLSCEVHPFNGESHIYYDITGKQTISCIFEKRKMSAADVESILLGIKNTLFNMQNYLLDADHLLLLPEYIYMDLSTKQIFFCFYPFETGDQEEKFSRLAEYLLEKIDHEEQQAVFAAYQFYRLIREKNSSFFQVVDQLYQYREENPGKEKEQIDETEEPEICEPEELCEPPKEEIIEHEKKEKGLFYIAMCLIMSGLCYGGYHYCIILDRMQRKLSVICKLPWFQTAVCLILLGVVFWGFSFYFYRSGKKRQKKQEIYEQVIPEEKTESKEFEVGTEITESPENMTGSEDNNELTVLLAECEYKEERCLVSADRKKTVISLTEFPFVIGKLEGVVDYVLTDKSVSRMHVKFMYHEDDDTVYMQDLNSTNGTYHNGIRLEGDEILPVYAQDEIRIGKRVFVYQ